MRALPPSTYGPAHPDFKIISTVERAILAVRPIQDIRRDIPQMFRDAIDSVIDTPNTRRRSYADLEKVEKTYIGTRIEILLRAYLKAPRGKVLDLLLGGVETDVKHTMGSNWMIPPEAEGHPCILTAADEDAGRCYFGLVVAHAHHLLPGSNRDRKRGLSPAGFASTRWILQGVPYPLPFWASLPEAVVQDIFAGSSGTDRIARLFRHVQGKKIHRDVVQAVAQQLDYMKRVRFNGGARDPLAAEGILLLSGKYDAELIKRLGLPACTPDEFISHRIQSAEEARLAKALGYGDVSINLTNQPYARTP
jgi:hypothetical protein